MQKLPNFGHITASIIWFDSRDKILLVTLWTKNYDVIIFILGKPKETNFADIIFHSLWKVGHTRKHWTIKFLELMLGVHMHDRWSQFAVSGKGFFLLILYLRFFSVFRVFIETYVPS